jgi:RHH-type proline utilization regulon transcriptional repressor/proline dehydrogenase/delta 1-pyrroline-5-carboxylate dehydrogenase
MLTPMTRHAHKNDLRDSITNAYRMDETKCIERLLATLNFDEATFAHIQSRARQLVLNAREQQGSQNPIHALLHQYALSTDEGVALMCLAEALLRIPDTQTMDKLISDKLSTANWKEHLDKDNSLFINATTWSLLLTGKMLSPLIAEEQTWFDALKRAGSRLGSQMVRPVILRMIKAMGEQFVLGQTIEEALKEAATLEKQGYRFSYDMLGEAARTEADAKRYYLAYEKAIDALTAYAKQQDVIQNPSISIKLSALYPRYEFAKRETVLQVLPPLLLSLIKKAKPFQVGITIDAEEADRLDLSLDIIEAVMRDSELAGWHGLGLAVQAYQKRALFVIDWLSAIAKKYHKRIPVRLVKGAYWDTEIKATQVQGLIDYPVFTRKFSTDVSYLACAKKLLAEPTCFYPCFATHNAYTVAAIIEMSNDRVEFEFQCLFGMGRELYQQIVGSDQVNRACRIYAPVGVHEDLLSYLVRRLLENGANTSFVHQITDPTVPVEEITVNPVARIASLSKKPHPHIPNPKDIYGEWQNSLGIDLSDEHALVALKARMDHDATKAETIHSLVVNLPAQAPAKPRYAPADKHRVIGHVASADLDTAEKALETADKAQYTWGKTTIEHRAAIFEKAATLFQEAMPELITQIILEGGRCVMDAMSEVRETIDYCRYYGYRARQDLATITLPGPTGELNQLSLHPRGPIACISPWNFPLAIFTGQVVAALAAGNPVIAKPAEQTPLIAWKAVRILHQAGVPHDALQLLIGKGSTVGAKIVSDPRMAGVMLTGSTETARRIQLALAERPGPIGLLIAETGGQNAMIVDSSALPEQAVVDIAQSAFNSAGQRCSALRVLFVQEDIAPKLLEMLKGYLAELEIGHPGLLTTDIGPVIDEAAKTMLQQHVDKMNRTATLIAEAKLDPVLAGHYFAPRVFEIPSLDLLEGEVFGPILHVIRYRADELDQVIAAITKTGYGLTLGIHSRIQSTVQYIAKRVPVGNIYVNRNMIGAVVGVQPFGGEHLSGTGPKAGGPHYLPRLCVERTMSTNTTAVGGNTRLVSLREDE